MLDAICRPKMQSRYVDPIAAYVLRRWAVKANYVTALACLVGIMAMPCLASGLNGLAILFIWFSGYLDVLDGSIARQVNDSSLRGTVYDIVSDRVVEFAVVFGLFLCVPEVRGLGCMLMLGSILICVTSFLVVGIVSDKASDKTFYYSPGLMERFEAFIFFTLMILLPEYFMWLSLLFTLLVLYTAAHRVINFRRLELGNV